MKRYRVETCYFGSIGLAVSRDAYMALKGEPSADNVPSLGEFPETRARPGDDKRVEGRAPILAAGRQLPFVRHVRACAIAKSLKEPANEELDAAVLEYDSYVSELNKTLLEASRYYARKQWEKDEFKGGKAIHDKLAKAFPELDERTAKFGQAVTKWLAETKDGEEVDDAGKVALEAVRDAREFSLMVLAPERDKAKMEELIAAVQKSHDALAAMMDAEATKEAPHPRVMVPKLVEFLTAAKEVAAIDGKLSGVQLYPTTAAMAELVEAHQRSLAQLLRKRGDVMAGGQPLRMLDPRVRPDARIRPTPRARPSASEPGDSPDPPAEPAE